MRTTACAADCLYTITDKCGPGGDGYTLRMFMSTEAVNAILILLVMGALLAMGMPVLAGGEAELFRCSNVACIRP